MSEADTQPVDTATEAQATPAVEAAVAQDTTSSLDALLSEFDSETKPQPAPQPVAPAAGQPNDQVTARLAALENRLLAEKNTKDFASALNKVKGDFDIPEWAVRGWLNEQAEKNPRVNDIWNNRELDPRKAEKLLAGLHNEFQKVAPKLKGPDPIATADRAAVAAAVKGTSTKAPDAPAPDYGKMSAAEFEAEKAKYL